MALNREFPNSFILLIWKSALEELAYHAHCQQKAAEGVADISEELICRMLEGSTEKQ